MRRKFEDEGEGDKQEDGGGRGEIWRKRREIDKKEEDGDDNGKR